MKPNFTVVLNLRSLNSYHTDHTDVLLFPKTFNNIRHQHSKHRCLNGIDKKS